MKLFIIILLILLNAFFAAAEIAFISLNDAKIDKQAKEGNKKAKKIKDMLINPSKFLATIQIGITLAGFLSSAFASETFASELAPILNNLVPQIGLMAWNNIAIVVITIILSYFTLIFGELVPKRLAMRNPEKIAFTTIGIIKEISVVTAPFVKFLTFSTDIISKIFGVSGKEEETVTEEEIRMMVDVGEEKGTIEQEEKNMINNIFEFNDKVASEIMRPRTEIFALDMNITVSEVIEELSKESRYSRIPVYDENIDNIKGIIYVKDILLANKNTKIKNLMKEAYYVSESREVNELFTDLRKNRKQIAIVIDEYGGTSGIITMEDILEEIVGEIYDEYDIEEDMIEKIDNNTYIFNGNIAIYEVEEVLNITIEEGDYDTLSGYLVERLGKIPTENDKGIIIEDDKVIYKIEKVENKHIVKVKACKIEEIDKEDVNDGK